MIDSQFETYYNMYVQAKELEKTDPDAALTIYDQILSKFTPEGTLYYERPCILLERKKTKESYRKAIKICERAIRVIEAKKFNANADEFVKRKERLVKKMNKL